MATKKILNNDVNYNEKVLEVNNLTKHFYVGVGKNKLTIPAVDGVSFDVYKREVFGLVGESGCGKTTTGRTIMKLYNPTQGTVKLNGKVIGAGYADRLKRIADIKKEAKEKLLLLNPTKKQIIDVRHRLETDLALREGEIQMILRDKVEAEKTIKHQLIEYQKAFYELNNDYELDLEKIKYEFDIKKTEILQKTVNQSELEYKKRLNGLKHTFKKKIEGIKDSAALEKEIINQRLDQLNIDYESKVQALKTEFQVKIKEDETKIISKEQAKQEIKKLQEIMKSDIATRKEKYLDDKEKLTVPDKSKSKNELKTLSDKTKKEIKDIRQKISALKKEAKKQILEISKNAQPLNNNSKSDIEQIKKWEKEQIELEKLKIKELKNDNSSKEALTHSRKMQMIFQDPISSLNPRMTVQEIIGEGLTINTTLTKEEIKEKVGEVLELVGLNREYATRYPHEFSGGQRQRIGVARALIMNPDFIIADEPISALDVSIRAQVINLLSELKDNFGLTIMFIAHDLSVVRFFCDRIAVMYNGKIVEMADSSELFNNPIHPYTKSLLSAIPQPDPDTEKNRTRIQYNPKQHDYRVDKPSLKEIKEKHFVLLNDAEFKSFQESQGVK